VYVNVYLCSGDVSWSVGKMNDVDGGFTVGHSSL
jgi:hypothetical protein